MSLLRSLSHGLRSLFRKERVSQELDEELNGFLDMAAEERMKQGMSRKDALRAVRLERGSLEITKEVVRSGSWESFVETCWRDFRYGLRVSAAPSGLAANCGSLSASRVRNSLSLRRLTFGHRSERNLTPTIKPTFVTFSGGFTREQATRKSIKMSAR